MIVSAAAALIGAGLSIYGQRQQAEAAQEAADYNAELLEAKAESVSQKAMFDAQQINKAKKKTIAAGRVQAAGSGVDVTSGSVMDWEGDIGADYELAQASTFHNARLQEFGLRGNAELARVEGRNAKTAANIASIGTAFSSVGQIGASYYNWSQAGI